MEAWCVHRDRHTVMHGYPNSVCLDVPSTQRCTWIFFEPVWLALTLKPSKMTVGLTAELSWTEEARWRGVFRDQLTSNSVPSALQQTLRELGLMQLHIMFSCTHPAPHTHIDLYKRLLLNSTRVPTWHDRGCFYRSWHKYLHHFYLLPIYLQVQIQFKSYLS